MEFLSLIMLAPFVVIGVMNWCWMTRDKKRKTRKS